MGEFGEGMPPVIESAPPVVQPEVSGLSSTAQPQPEATSPHETIEAEGKRIAAGIISERQRIIAEKDPFLVPGDAEKSYDYAMRLNILRTLESAKSAEASSQDAQKEQQRQIELEGIRKAQVDLIAGHYDRVPVKGEKYHKTTSALVDDISIVSTKVNIFRLDSVVRQELHKTIMGEA